MENWQLNCYELKQRGAYLYRTKLWADITLKLNADDQTYSSVVMAHKLMLAMASPTFARLFYDGSYENPVSLNVSPEAFLVLLEYIYSDNLNIHSVNLASELYDIALQYQFPYVAMKCVSYIMKGLNPSNVCQLYEKYKHVGKPFKHACMKIFTMSTMDVIQHESFLQASLETVEDIFSLERLNIDTELDLLHAAVKHANAHDVEEDQEDNEDKEGPSPCKKKCKEVKQYKMCSNNCTMLHSTVSANTIKKKEFTSLTYKMAIRKDKRIAEQRSEYRRVVKHIRFLTLTSQEFADCRSITLLSDCDLMAVNMCISSKDTYIKMADEFSTRMVPRNLATEPDRYRSHTVYRTTIQQVSMVKKHTSHLFYMHNLAWMFHMRRPISDGAGADTTYFVVTCFTDTQTEWMDAVDVRLCIRVPFKVNSLPRFTKHPLSAQHQVTWSLAVKSTLLTDPGYVFHNTLTCEIFVSVVPSRPATTPGHHGTPHSMLAQPLASVPQNIAGATSSPHVRVYGAQNRSPVIQLSSSNKPTGQVRSRVLAQTITSSSNQSKNERLSCPDPNNSTPQLLKALTRPNIYNINTQHTFSTEHKPNQGPIA